MRWKCIKCFDFDLCTSCYMSGKHDLQHEFIRQDSPESPRYEQKSVSDIQTDRQTDRQTDKLETNLWQLPKYREEL